MVWVAAAMLVVSVERASAADSRAASPLELMPELKHMTPGTPTDPKKLFQLIDENGNGVIDRSEWSVRKMAVFYIRDANQDMRLSRNEVPGIGGDWFEAADDDKDGFLSGLEFIQADFAQFEAFGANRDGNVTLDEFTVFLRRLKE